MQSILNKKFMGMGAVLMVMAMAAALALGLFLATGGDAEAAKKRDKGNGAPSGSHYTLNIIGVAQGKTATMKGTKGVLSSLTSKAALKSI